MTKQDFKIGDSVKHRFRNNYYQKCTVIEIEDGCNGLILVSCEDMPIYDVNTSGSPIIGTEKGETFFCPQDLARINS